MLRFPRVSPHSKRNNLYITYVHMIRLKTAHISREITFKMLIIIHPFLKVSFKKSRNIVKLYFTLRLADPFLTPGHLVTNIILTDNFLIRLHDFVRRCQKYTVWHVFLTKKWYFTGIDLEGVRAREFFAICARSERHPWVYYIYLRRKIHDSSFEPDLDTKCPLRSS